jgi:hypothetical protein
MDEPSSFHRLDVGDWVEALVGSPDSTRIAAGSDGTTVIVYPVVGRDPVTRIPVSRRASVTFSPDGQVVGVADAEQVAVHRAGDGGAVWSGTLHRDRQTRSRSSVVPRAFRVRPGQVWQVPSSPRSMGAASREGFWLKKPEGLSQNDTTSTGMTGHSSMRVMWWMPKTYQRTTSVFCSDASSLIHSLMPVSTVDWVG